MSHTIDDVVALLNGWGLDKQGYGQGFVALTSVIAQNGTPDDVFARKDVMVGAWDLAEVKPYLGSGTRSTYERYEFRSDFTYGYSTESSKSYVGSPFAPDAGNSVYSGPAGWSDTGYYLPGPAAERGRFEVLLFRANKAEVRKLLVRRDRDELEIQYRNFKPMR